ncbi:hypothetical protein RE0327_27640 [Prescottella equi]|nr:hypothetical protein RE0327_27640 [Prescottella equi]BCN84152.1 hypothetical protein RE0356_27930 [Prescottella equi]
MSWSTTTRVPPEASGPHISHTEKSNEKAWNIAHTEPSAVSSAFRAFARSVLTLVWATCTPLGRPVEPDV